MLRLDTEDNIYCGKEHRLLALHGKDVTETAEIQGETGENRLAVVLE